MSGSSSSCMPRGEYLCAILLSLSLRTFNDSSLLASKSSGISIYYIRQKNYHVLAVVCKCANLCFLKFLQQAWFVRVLSSLALQPAIPWCADPRSPSTIPEGPSPGSSGTGFSRPLSRSALRLRC